MRAKERGSNDAVNEEILRLETKIKKEQERVRRIIVKQEKAKQKALRDRQSSGCTVYGTK
jgi:hypothetical protein